jgi:hypothetical protein
MVWAIKHGQSRETGNLGNTRYKMKTNQTKHNMCWTPSTHIHTNNVNNT